MRDHEFKIALRGRPVAFDVQHGDVFLYGDDGEVLDWRLTDEEWLAICMEGASRGYDYGDWHYNNPGSDAEPTIANLMAIPKLNPHAQTWHIVGGCLALRHDCDDGGHLVMDLGELRILANGATRVVVGRYAQNGDVAEAAKTISLNELEAWIDAALGRAKGPQTVADYFLKKLGTSHDDESLGELPIESSCGQDCVKAIDTATALIDHIRTGFDQDRPQHIDGVVRIAQEVVAVYWRG